MNKTKWTVTALAVMMLIMAFAMAAQAQAARTFVAARTGNNANVASNCGGTTPCANLSTAFSVTNAGGEIVVIESGGVGGLPNINKSVTITADAGASAFIQPVGTALTINGGVNDVVVLRNLTINGFSSAAGSNGIQFNTGKSLIIDNCVVQGFPAAGLRAVAGTIVVTRSSFLSNTLRGVHASGTAKIDLHDCIVGYNGKGITVDGAGGCPQGSPQVLSTTVVRMDLGLVSNNTLLAFEMINPGAGCPGDGNGKNIFLRTRSGGSDFSTDVPGYQNQNTTYISVTGVGAPAGGAGSQILIGTYSSTNQGVQP